MSEPTSAEIMEHLDRDALKHKAVAAKDAVADLASEAAHFAAGRAARVKSAAAGLVETSKEKAVRAGSNALRYVQRRPYQSLAVAVGIGFVVGTILKRR